MIAAIQFMHACCLHMSLCACAFLIIIQLHFHDAMPSCFMPLDITVVRNIISIDVSVLALGCHLGDLDSLVVRCCRFHIVCRHCLPSASHFRSGLKRCAVEVLVIRIAVFAFCPAATGGLIGAR